MGCDLIDRAKLLANTENYVLSDWGPAIAVADIEEADREDAVLVRHGKWLRVSSEELSLETLIEEKCSLCGRYVARYDSEMMDAYCPNCGAKMDAEETT